MPFDTFPIPAGKPDIAVLQQRVRENAARLGEVIVSLNQALWNRLEGQDMLLNAVETPLKSSIAARNGRTMKKLHGVVQELYGQVNDRNAITGAQLDNIASTLEEPPSVPSPLMTWKVIYRCDLPDMNDPQAVTAFYGTDGKDGTGLLSQRNWVFYKDYGTDVNAAHNATVDPTIRQAILSRCPQNAPVAVPPPTVETSTPSTSGTATPTPTTAPIEIDLPSSWTTSAPAPSPSPTPSPSSTLTASFTPPTIPSEGTTDTLPEFSCQVALDWVSPITPPGSPEWCRWADATLKGFASIFDQVNIWEQQLLDPDNIDQVLAGYKPMGAITFPPGYIVDAIVSLIKRLATGGRPVLKLAKEILDCMRQLTNKMFARCDPRALTVLILVRALLESLKRTRLGTDALAWVTVDVVFPIRPLEETIERLIDYVCPLEAPSVGEAIEAWLRGYIDDNLLHCIQRIHGQDADSFAAFVKARGEKIGSREAINWVRRQGGGREDEKSLLRKLGWVDDDQTDKFQELYWEIPTIGDHLEWLRKNVFDKDYVRDFRLMEGFEERFWPRFGHDLTVLGMRKENAGLHYAAHWINPSFSQQFDMVQRLRPGRVDPSLVFTRDDLLRTMQEMDVGPYFRERLERVSHSVINLTLLMKLFGLKAVDDKDFVERLQDLGYTKEDAEVMHGGLVYEVARLRASSGRGWNPSILARLYGLGLISDDFVSTKMGLLGYSDSETADLLERSPLEQQARTKQRVLSRTLSASVSTAVAAYRCGAADRDTFVSTLDGMSVDSKTANAWADQIDASISVDLCKQQIAAIKTAVMRGKITLDRARDMLSDSGVPELRTTQYLKSWRIQLEARSPAATASQILRWVAEGLMDEDTATQRLHNLGWTDADVTVQLAEAKGRLARLNARASAAAAKDEHRKAKELAQLTLDAGEVTDRLKRDLKTVETPGRLQKWYKLGVIDAGYFRDRMADLGFGFDVIDLYQAEIDNAKRDAAARQASKKARPANHQPGVGEPGAGGGEA